MKSRHAVRIAVCLCLLVATATLPQFSVARPGAQPVGPCTGLYDEPGDGLCTHGPDTIDDLGGPGIAPAAAAPPIQCDPADGTSGKRVQMVYLRRQSDPDRSATVAATLQQYARDIDLTYDASAAETGGMRHVRFVTDASCNAVVLSQTMPDTAVTSNSLTTYTQISSRSAEYPNSLPNRLPSLFANNSRKYMVWLDFPGSCQGVGTIYPYDSPSLTNPNNTNYGYAITFFPSCDGDGASRVMAHELMHTLGSVQNSAPHSTAHFPPSGGHCFDENDRMCYQDHPSVVLQILCPDAGHDNRFDCNHDDYFYAGTPPAANYLSTHWNTANSEFLSTGTIGPPAAPPNNAFAAAAALNGNAGSVSGSTVGATKEPGEPAHAGNAGGASVWYRWTAPSSSTATISTAGSNFDTLLAAYTGNAVGSLSPMASNNNFGSAVTSQITFNAVAGTTYSIAVDGFGGATGQTVLAWSVAGSLADLVGQWAVQPTQSCTSVCTIRGTIRVLNQGPVASPKSSVRFVLSNDATYDTGDRVLKPKAVSKLQPSASKTSTVTFKLPSGVSGAGKFLIATVDATATTPESNESNNSVSAGPLG